MRTLSVFDVVRHRPYPVPARPWFMFQCWLDVLFAHWPVPVAALQPHIPPSLAIDLFEGQAWLGIIPFSAKNPSASFQAFATTSGLIATARVFRILRGFASDILTDGKHYSACVMDGMTIRQLGLRV